MSSDLDDLLDAFRHGDGDDAWPVFLEKAGGLLLQAARSLTRDEDEAADTFVFICEQLAAGGFGRLRRFDPSGPASVATWLRAVARNLGLDFLRRRHGRFRVFDAIARMPLLEQLVFRRRHRDRFSLAETFATLRPQFPHLSFEAVAAADHRVELALSSRHHWTLAAAQPRLESLDSSTDGEADARRVDPPDREPSPEQLVAGVERNTRLRDAVRQLPPEDRLLVRLRLEQDLTLAEVARVAGLSGPQQADRRLREIYARLRGMLA